MACPNCKVSTGRELSHSNGECPQAVSFLCRRCNTRGHMTRHCKESWPQWERPTTLEELIPPDIRIRYGITTHTPIVYDTNRGDPGTERELERINEICIPSDYNELIKFTKKYNMNVETVTKPPKENLVAAIKTWGLSHGYRIVERLCR